MCQPDCNKRLAERSNILPGLFSLMLKKSGNIGSKYSYKANCIKRLKNTLEMIHVDNVRYAPF